MFNQPRIIVVAKSMPPGRVGGPRTVRELDPLNSWLDRPDYKHLRPARFTVNRVTVKVDEGSGPSLEGFVAQLVVDKFMEELRARASGRGILAESPPRLAAVVLAAAAKSGINPARVTLRVDSEEEDPASFLIERLRDAVNLIGAYALWDPAGKVGLQYLDDLARMVKEAASRGSLTELERFAVSHVAEELWVRAFQLREYMDKVFGFTIHSKPTVEEILRETFWEARDPDVKRLAETLIEAVQGYDSMLFNMLKHTLKLRRTEDPAQIAHILAEMYDTLQNHWKTISWTLDNAEAILETLKNKPTILSDEEEIKKQLLEA